MKYNLSEVTEIIRNRRSIAPEHYTDRAVHPEIIKHILTNGTWAPTHGMNQPWFFHVFREDGLKRLSRDLPEMYADWVPGDKFSQAKKDKLQRRFETISAAVFICMKRDMSSRIPEIEDVEAVACAVQNMSLTATAYGLGCFWSSPGFVYTPEMNAYLGLEDSDKCLGIFYMGYPGIEWPQSHRRPLEYHTAWIEE